MNDDANFERQVLNRMSALIDTIGPLTGHISRLADDIGRHDGEFLKLNRRLDRQFDMIDLRAVVAKSDENLAKFRFDMTNRMDAISLRLDEIEATGERTESLARSLGSETISLHNAVLNAIHESANNSLALKRRKNASPIWSGGSACELQRG